MALARIITRFAEDSQPLAEDLRARGFEVQTWSPEQTPSEPADLEITLEECAPAEALKRARGAADPDVHVFIAPGAMTENGQPRRVVPLIPKPDVELQAVTVGDPEMEPEAFENIAAVTSHSDPLVPPEPEPAFAAASNLEAQSEALEAFRAVRPEPEPVMPQASAPVRHWPIRQPVAPPAEITGVEEQSAYQVEAPADAVLEQPQPEPAQVAPVQVVPFQVLPFRIASLIERAVSHGIGISGWIALERLARKDKLFWRTAIGAGLATVGALLLVFSARSAPPLPAGLVQSSGNIQRQVPFANPKRSAKVRARTTTLARGLPALTNVEASIAKPAAAVKRPAPKTAEGEAAESKVTLASNVKSKAQPGSSANSEADVVAKDTVIRYGSQPAASSAPAHRHPEVKHYSDLK
jgi:hypothetical protein